MKVSVITVCYNAERTIARTLESVQAQTHPDIEHLIIDGGSTDNTFNVIAPYRARIAQVVSEADNGIYDAMNKGIARATGEVLFFLNADDAFADPTVVAAFADAFAGGEADIMYGDIIHHDHITGKVSYHRNDRVDWFQMLTGSITQQAIFYRACAFAKAGGFDTQYRIVGDYEWLLRAFYRHRLTTHYVPVAVCDFDAGGCSGTHVNTATQTLHHVERRTVIRAYFSNLRYTMTHSQPLRQLFFNRYNRYATARILTGHYRINVV